ncbi:hypothetical protein [Hyunsoonleella pacifica]|uniref:PL28 ulvan lyase domain-containing protein n=1 Tax=Hyunsoonleella pacifica TaxID=1080224 RepID=A0A4Q9FSE3_9FLAO|nr:hypothetical protein [Hyunsoonleella pacifica]TBN18746.1 hypothetical protein EYD46_01390 [Hyunsoonleella pacifica]GGD04366.1 hypothetical protein GCM10011368_02780 [Hyunsoonleella pacifica]
MKRQLNFTKTRVFRSFFLVALIITYGCSQNEDIVYTNDESSKTKSTNGTLTGKGTNPTEIGSCDNPQDSNGDYYRRYTVGELNGLSDSDDLVQKNAINGRGVDKMRFLDDRTCAFNYSQSGNYGIYRIRSGSNRFGSTLQPRIEREARTVNRGGSRFVSVEGVVNIRSVGTGNPSSIRNTNLATIQNQQRAGEGSGTYIIQAKGQHENQTEGSGDPAILLILAKPANPGPGGIPRYNLYAEQILRPGGEGSDGREIKFLKTIDGNTDVFIKMTNRFSSTGLTQRVDVQIGRNPTLKFHSFLVPNDRGRKRGKNAKIRFGVYRCNNGSADIRWRNVRHNFRD